MKKDRGNECDLLKYKYKKKRQHVEPGVVRQGTCPIKL